MMIKKIFISVIALTLLLHATGIYPISIYATSGDQSTSAQNAKNETDITEVNVKINGVKGETNGRIALGEIKPIQYNGYAFVNATVDGAIVNYIGVYEGKYYYTNTNNQDSGTYLLEDLEIQLNYEETIESYKISYNYDKSVLKVIGADSVDSKSNTEFRIEMIKHNYEITSVIANGKVLTADENGYYKIENVTQNITVDIQSKIPAEYKVNVNKKYIPNIDYSGADKVAAGADWVGKITTSNKITLNSIIVNDQYLNTPSGGGIYSSETKETTLSDGTKVKVNVSRNNAWNPYVYIITVSNVKSNLNIMPALYNKDGYDITFTSIEGVSIYHWNGSQLNQLNNKGDRINKGKGTDYFFAKTQTGYEAEIKNFTGEGTKIIEKIDDVKNLPEAMIIAAKEKGCQYVFYYSDNQIEHRTVSIGSQLIQYSVKYNLNGGTGSITDTNKYNIDNKKIIKLSSTTPTRDGYTFVGWKLTDTGKMYQTKDEVVINEKLANALKKNIISFDAQWVKNEELKTSSFAIRYYFQQSDGTFKEDVSLRKIVNNAPIGATAILMDKGPINQYEFDASNSQNVLTTKVCASGQTISLKAYYIEAVRNITYGRGNSKAGVGQVPLDNKNPYKKGTKAIVLGNIGNLVGNFENANDSKFVCWKSTTTDKFYFPGDEVVMNDDLKLSAMFVGNLLNGQSLTFTSGSHGTISGQSKFAVPSGNKFGKVITSKDNLPTANANVGYKFNGWYVGDTKVASDEITLYNYVKDLDKTIEIEASFVEDHEQKHNISYKVNYYKGDTLEEAKKARPETTIVAEKGVWAGKTVLDVQPIDKDKYQGYLINSTNPESLPKTIKNGSNIDVYYVKDKGQWTTVQFNVGDHGLLNGMPNNVIFENVLINKTFSTQNIKIPTVTAQEGWLFNGWDINVNTNTVIKKNMVITAQYAEDKNKDGIPDKDQYVTVTFNAGDHGNYNGKQISFTEKMLPGDKILTPKLATSEGYVFTKYTPDVLETIPTNFNEKELVYTAQYAEDKNKDGIPDEDQYVTVTFNAGDHGNYNGQKEVSTEKMLPGDKITNPTLTTNEGYVFTKYNADVLETIPTNLNEKELVYTAQYTVAPVAPIVPEEPIVPVPPIAPIITPPAPNAPITPIVPTIPVTPGGAVADNPVTITPNEVPQGNGDNVADDNQTIDDNQVPQAKVDGTWALINLVSAIATVVVAAILFVLKNKKDEESSNKLGLTIKVMSAVIAVASVIIFFVTEDMSLKMAMSDNWTLAMVGLLAVQIILAVFKKIKD